MAGAYLQEAAAMKDDLVAWRRHLHQIPELGLDVPQTSAYIQDELGKLGISYQVSTENSHIVAILGAGERCFLLRSDMDALPMSEDSGLEYASANGNMHACGHDMHAASLLGAAALLKAHEGELKGRVKLLFQSGEEVFRGAQTAIDEGVLENPKVDAAFAAHMASASPVGAIGYGYFPMSAVYGFKIGITGRGTHGSTPEKGVDPINAGVHIFLALQELIAREASASSEVVITIGRFEGGSVNNVIPERAVLEGTLRAFDPEVRTFMIRRIGEVAERVGAVYGADVTVTATSDCPAVVNDRTLTDELMGVLKDECSGLDILPVFHAMGSEDFAFFSDKVPCCYIAVGARFGEDYPAYSEHNPQVRFNEDALVVNSAIYATVATAWLGARA